MKPEVIPGVVAECRRCGVVGALRSHVICGPGGGSNSLVVDSVAWITAGYSTRGHGTF